MLSEIRSAGQWNRARRIVEIIGGVFRTHIFSQLPRPARIVEISTAPPRKRTPIKFSIGASKSGNNRRPYCSVANP